MDAAGPRPPNLWLNWCICCWSIKPVQTKISASSGFDAAGLMSSQYDKPMQVSAPLYITVCNVLFHCEPFVTKMFYFTGINYIII